MKKIIRAEFRTDSIDLVNFIIKHFRVFIITGILAAVISAVISLMLKPLFESQVVLYPSSNVVETNTMMGGVSSSTSVFGDDEATERLLQILRSEQIKEYLKKKYNLMEHYNIKPGEKYPNTKMEQKMKKNIHSSKTSFGSVEIRVRDRDRDIACQMANDIAARADTIFNNVQRETASKLLVEVRKSYESQLKLVKMYEDTLKYLTGLLGISGENQGRDLYKAYFEASVTGDRKTESNLEKQLNVFQSNSPEFLRIYTTLESETEYLSHMRGRYLESFTLSNQTLPYTLIVDKGTVAEKKIWPKRSHMVIIATLSALMLLALLLFISDSLTLHRDDAGK